MGHCQPKRKQRALKPMRCQAEKCGFGIRMGFLPDALENDAKNRLCETLPTNEDIKREKYKKRHEICYVGILLATKSDRD